MPSRTLVQGKSSVCQGELIFSENFDTTNLKDLARWTPEVKFPQEPVRGKIYNYKNKDYMGFIVNCVPKNKISN